MEERQHAGGEVDLIEDFAAAIPVEVIGNLLGVPREERGPLRDWSLAILGALEPQPSAAQLDAGNRAVTEMVAYLRGLVLERRRHPGDPAHDVLTRLIQGEEDGGDRLTENELLPELHLHPQRRARDHHQPDRQRPGRAARMA